MGTQGVSAQCSILVSNGLDVTNARSREGTTRNTGREQHAKRSAGRLTTETRKHGVEKPGKEVRANQRLAIAACSHVGLDGLGRQSQICANGLQGEEEEGDAHKTIRLMPRLRAGTLKLISNPTRHPVSFM